MVGTDTHGKDYTAGGQKDHKKHQKLEKGNLCYTVAENLTKTASGNLETRSQEMLLDLSDEAFRKSGEMPIGFSFVEMGEERNGLKIKPYSFQRNFRK